MKAEIDEKTCIGCGLCSDNCPSIFELADALARVKAQPETEEDRDCCRRAADVCPVECISIKE